MLKEQHTTLVEQAVIERLPQTSPADEFNRELVRNVHPVDWVNPNPSGRYNLVVIGAGTAGLVTAAGAAGLGAKVALVERDLMGGDCLNVGCVPSKGIISAARVAAAVRNAREFGVEVPDGVNVNFAAAKKGVKVNERMQTTNSNIYAAGDVCSPYQFTHAADFMARIVIQNALFMGRKKSASLVIPWCTYTSPEIAHVGLYEEEARKQGIEVGTFVQEFRDVDRAILYGADEGFVKVHVKKGTDKIVGATIVAGHAGDMISEITLAMTHACGSRTPPM